MDPTIKLNDRVEVVTVFKEHGVLCGPAKMRWKNRDIVLSELAFRHPTAKGQRMIHVFDVSDGISDYRLEFDAEGLTWTLVAMLDGSQQPARERSS